MNESSRVLARPRVLTVIYLPYEACERFLSVSLADSLEDR